MLNLQIFGDPVAQGRPSAFRRGNHIGMYDPGKSKDWKSEVRWQAIEQKARNMEGALVLELIFLLKRPKSLPRKVLHHIKKPDLDNLVKAIKDALKGICYRDDSQIVRINAEKIYATDKTGVVISLRNI